MQYDFREVGLTGLISVETYFSAHRVYSITRKHENYLHLSKTAIYPRLQFRGLVTSVWSKHVTVVDQKHRELLAFFHTSSRPTVNEWLWILEYYSVDMEQDGQTWLALRKPITDNSPLFINIDEVNAQDTIVRRLRIDPILGKSRILGTYENALGIKIPPR